MLISKDEWNFFRLVLIIAFSFLFSGCPAIETRAPLLTEKNAEVIENIEGYFYAFDPDRKSEDDYVGFIEILGTDEKNKYEYSSLFESGYHFLRFIEINEHWLLLQSELKEEKSKGIYLWFIGHEEKQASLYVNKKGYSLNLEGFPNLVGHVSNDSGNLVIDETAATTLSVEVIEFLKREFTKYKINLEKVIDLGPADERTAFKNWCQQAVKDIYSERNWERTKKDSKLKFKIDYSVTTCKRAVVLNPDSVELQRDYGKALHKAKRFSEALQWLNKN